MKTPSHYLTLDKMIQTDNILQQVAHGIWNKATVSVTRIPLQKPKQEL